MLVVRSALIVQTTDRSGNLFILVPSVRLTLKVLPEISCLFWRPLYSHLLFSLRLHSFAQHLVRGLSTSFLRHVELEVGNEVVVDVDWR